MGIQYLHVGYMGNEELTVSKDRLGQVVVMEYQVVVMEGMVEEVEMGILVVLVLSVHEGLTLLKQVM